MNKELFVSSTPHETKVAVVEEDQLAEIYFERENEYTLAGSIYKGRVTRVLPGMQSAFVDIGLERDAFLYVTDFLEEQDAEEDVETEPVPSAPRQRYESRAPESPAQPSAQGSLVIEGGNEAEEEQGAETSAEPAQAAESDGEGARRWRGRRRRGGRDRGSQPEARAPQQRSESSEPSMERYGPPPGYQPIILPGESIAKFNRPAESSQPSEPASVPAFANEQQQEAAQPAPPSEAQPSGERDRGWRNRGERRFQRGRDERRDDRRPRYESREPRRERTEQQWGSPAGYQPIVLPGESIAKYRGIENSPPPASAPEVEIEQEREEHAHVSAEAPVAQFSREEPDSATAGFAAAPAPQVVEEETVEEEQMPELHAPEQHLVSDAAFVEEEQEGPETVAADEELEYHDIPAPAEAPPQQTEQKRDRWFRKLGSIFGHHEEQAPATSPAAPQFEPEPHAEHGAPGGEVSSAGEAAHPDLQDDSRASFSPGQGHLEEEEIEEEESDYLAPGEELEEDEFEELEEHIMDRVAAEAGEVNAGEQLTEAVEEADSDERAEEGYEGHEPVNGDEQGNGHAQVRGGRATAGYQQRAQRPGFDRRPGRFRRGGRFAGRRREAPRPNLQIAELLKEGQEILVQIAKEPIGKKGARITSHIALPGRFLVYMPTVNHIGVSRKISSEEERQRLKRIVLSERENGHGGFIVRTAADRADENELRADIRFLKNLWHEIRERAEKSKPPALIYHDLNLVERILRDQVNENFTAIWVDTESEYERVVRFVGRFQPSLSRRVKLYSKETPLFEQFGVQEEINKALKSKVWLKSGGYIVINQTEALVAIDVNTGKYVGKTARLEDTIVKTNVDAIKEIVRQVRLRDLGGIIVIDFIDMDERKNRHRVMQALEEALKSDRAPSKVLQFNDFGLVAITRKRVKQSLERTLGAPCQHCTGTGLVKSTTTVCNEIWVEMRKMSRHFERPDILLRVHPEVAKALKANNGRWIQDIEELTGKNLIVKSDPAVHPEQFDIT